MFGRKSNKFQTTLGTLKDVLLSTWNGSAPAHHTSELADATAKVIESLVPFDSAAIRLGQLIAVKITRDGKPMLRVDTISPALSRRLAGDPKLLLRPEEVWDLFDILQHEEEGQPQLTAPKKPPELPAHTPTQTPSADHQS